MQFLSATGAGLPRRYSGVAPGASAARTRIVIFTLLDVKQIFFSRFFRLGFQCRSRFASRPQRHGALALTSLPDGGGEEETIRESPFTHGDSNVEKR
jgi:hypothetical protein